MKYKNQSGFSLIEMAVVLTVVGLLMGAMVSLFLPYVEQVKKNTTEKKLDNIAHALALFGEKYGRLPCPADPSATDATDPAFGFPINSGAGGKEFARNPCAPGGVDPVNGKGIVPFKVLGLNEDNVTDSYGNLITYAVNQVLTRLNSETRTATSFFELHVHEYCHTPQWVENGVSKNFLKAYLCCPNFSALPSGDQISVKDIDGNYVFMRLPVVGGAYSQAPNFGPIPYNRIGNEGMAFVLISHGSNGDGAYLPRSASKKLVTIPGSKEENNYLSDLEFVDGEISMAQDSNYFDDIVVWKTNEQLASMLGNGSCVRP